MLKIGEFANLFNISIKTVRFYEEKELFNPFYIDKYSGYRYYNEKNIDEMSRILYLKNLGFSLEEIKNYDEKQLKGKIEEYKQKIIRLKNNINILENLHNENNEKGGLKKFLNDERAIGKWSLKGMANTKEEAKRNIFESNILFNIKELYLMENGQSYWVISWSKDFIYINGRKNPYEIEGNLMYVEILYPEDNALYMVAVYEKENDRRYTIDEIRKKDKFNGYYKEDQKIIGFWKTVNYIKVGQKFNYKIQRSKGEFELLRLTVNPEDNSILIYMKDKEPRISKYTKNYIQNLIVPDTMCKYTYQRINGKEYITVECKTDDYIYGKKLYGYYVLEKIGGKFMEEVLEKKENIYTILSKEKNGLLLGKDIYLPEDKRGNVNVLVVAGSGAGKSASYTIPNILNMLGSYIITDPWGEVYEKTHKYLEDNGYIVKTVNYENSKDNYKYNPLNHIKDERDIDILTDILMGNEEDDEFWNESCKCFIKTILYYVMEKEEKKDLLTCFKLMSLEKDKFFEKLDKLSENSKLAKYYSILKTYPEKTYSSVVSTAIMKLAFVINAIPEDRNYEEKFDFTDLRNNKMAIFLICEENCKEDKKIINIFISQLLSQLKMFDSSKEHIYFILDEVNMFGKIYQLPRNIEIARARKISITLSTNNLGNLHKIYGDDFYNIINTIDTQLLLGTMLKSDIDYFSDITGLDNEFIKNDLGREQLLIYEKGLKPIIAEKQYYFNEENWKS